MPPKVDKALTEEEALAAAGLDPEAELRESLSRKGYLVVKQERVADIRRSIDIIPFQGGWIRLGFVADNHFASRFQQLQRLHEAYRLFEYEGIEVVLHAGDLTDGQDVYKGHEFELFCHGADAQVDYLVENYPREPGITTYFILGNHDESHWKKAGVDIGRQIAQRRADMDYLCTTAATITVPNDPKAGVDIYLLHPSGGVSYARSYKPQRRIEQFAPEQKPKIVAFGHWHCQDVLPRYQNVFSMMLPCFQAQTPYLKDKGLLPEVGPVILEFMPDGEGWFTRIRHEFITGFSPIKDDY